MTTDDLTALEALAKAATQGPWETRSGFVRSPMQGNVYESGDGTFLIKTSCKWVAECRDGEAFDNWQANAAYIAACHPAAVLDLIARVRRYQNALTDDGLEAYVKIGARAAFEAAAVEGEHRAITATRAAYRALAAALPRPPAAKEEE